MIPQNDKCVIYDGGNKNREYIMDKYTSILWSPGSRDKPGPSCIHLTYSHTRPVSTGNK